MNDEINVKEIILILWRGKYLIAGVTALFTLIGIIYIFCLVTPAYQQSVFLDLDSYGIKGKEILDIIEQNGVIGEAVEDLSDDSSELVQSIKVSTINDNESVLKIWVKHSDPNICMASTEQIGLAIIKIVSEYRITQMNLEKERNEKLLAYIDDAVQEYLLTRDDNVTDYLQEDPIYKRILQEKAECLIKLKLLDFNLTELVKKPESDVEFWLNGFDDPVKYMPVSKKTYLAVAFLMGLMISLIILFVYHYFATQFSSSTKP